MLLLLAEKWTPHSAGIAYLAGGRPVRTLADENQVWVLEVCVYPYLPWELRFLSATANQPMVCFVNVESVDLIIYSIFQRFNLEWKTCTLFTQAA
jgi:hypothetical protein